MWGILIEMVISGSLNYCMGEYVSMDLNLIYQQSIRLISCGVAVNCISNGSMLILNYIHSFKMARR